MTRFMVRFCLVLIALAMSASFLVGQEEENLIPNPGFERYSGTPLGWFFSGKDFTRVMQYWESPTAASPDVYGAKVHVPTHWRDKGFGEARPHSGGSMVGITVYGCDGGKPHCREYLQTHLNEPLVIGQRYAVRCWMQPLPRGYRVNNIGFYFSEERISSLTDEVLNYQPQVYSEELLSPRGGGWMEFSGEFIAETEANYLLIGNFQPDEETLHKPGARDALGYGYYYIDDVQLRKLEPILDVPVRADDLSRLELSEGQLIELKNIYFDHDKADFLPRSFRELNALVARMQENPDMEIEIRGHTDNVGTSEYNHELSLIRAKAVADYLVGKGIDRSRLEYEGFGSTQPVASNATEYGRQMNRRVEFLIVKFPDSSGKR